MGLGDLNGVPVTLSGMKCVNIDNKTVENIGANFSYNKNLVQDKIFLLTYCQNRKHFIIMARKTVNVRRKNYVV